MPSGEWKPSQYHLVSSGFRCEISFKSAASLILLAIKQMLFNVRSVHNQSTLIILFKV